ncbi:ABC transporter ATP-binding protein, partial [Streptococcus pyogenes]
MIQFDHVSKIYQDKAVVDDISLTIQEGELITILGTS